MNRGRALVAIGSLLVLSSFAAIFLVLMAGDHDEYGRVGVPGENTLQLPDDEVIVFYEEARSVGEESLEVPALAWQIRPSGGGPPLALDGDGGVEVGSREDYSYTDIERLGITQEGKYRVSVQPATGTGPSPTLTFGTSGATTLRVLMVSAGLLVGLAILVLALMLPPRPRVLPDS